MNLHRAGGFLNECKRLKALVLDSVSSPIARLVYNMALDEFAATSAMKWMMEDRMFEGICVNEFEARRIQA